MMRKIFLLTSLVFLFLMINAQVAPDKYFIRFTDKNNSPYSLDHPEAFLSQRALDRRLNQGISLDEHDLPVTPSYVEKVAQKGVTILNRSRWLNGILIYTSDPALIDSIGKLPFIRYILKNQQNDTGVPEYHDDKFKLENKFNRIIMVLLTRSYTR
jgi:serine protease AprX